MVRIVMRIMLVAFVSAMGIALTAGGGSAHQFDPICTGSETVTTVSLGPPKSVSGSAFGALGSYLQEEYPELTPSAFSVGVSGPDEVVYVIRDQGAEVIASVRAERYTGGPNGWWVTHSAICHLLIGPPEVVVEDPLAPVRDLVNDEGVE